MTAAARAMLGVLACLSLALGVLGSVAHAQDRGVDLGEVRPTLPALPPPRSDTSDAELLTLPPLVLPSEGAPLGARAMITVQRFVFSGHSVFDDAELEHVVAPYTGHPIDAQELVAARDAVTRLYHDHGYVTSGAVLPEQDASSGRVTLQIIEGAVSVIEIEGHHRIRDAYLRPRLERAVGAPVQIARLRRALVLLQQNRWIETIDAHLEPGARDGEARLVVRVTEAHQWQLGAEVSNDRPPTVGSIGGSFDGTLANVVGLGDVWSARFQITSGYRDIQLRFDMPVTPWDAHLRFDFRDTKTEIVEAPFDVLDIEGRARRYALSFFQPLFRSEADELWLELGFDHTTTQSTILGLDFCFEVQAPDCAEPVVTALRLALQWTRSTERNAFSARSVFSFGIDALGASVSDVPDTPDGEFFAWLGQAQWAHVLPDGWLRSTVLLRGDSQLANSPLLAIERIAVGGRRTVRGYRENRLVRDNGVILSGEVRVPVWRTSLDRPVLEVVPFMDYGYAWNVVGESPTPTEQLWSVGAGLRFTPRKGTLAEVYWGARIDDRQVQESDIQDYGISFRVRIDAPDVF